MRWLPLNYHGWDLDKYDIDCTLVNKTPQGEQIKNANYSINSPGFILSDLNPNTIVNCSITANIKPSYAHGRAYCSVKGVFGTVKTPLTGLFLF